MLIVAGVSLPAGEFRERVEMCLNFICRLKAEAIWDGGADILDRVAFVPARVRNITSVIAASQSSSTSAAGVGDVTSCFGYRKWFVCLSGRHDSTKPSPQLESAFCLFLRCAECTATEAMAEHRRVDVGQVGGGALAVADIPYGAAPAAAAKRERVQC